MCSSLRQSVRREELNKGVLVNPWLRVNRWSGTIDRLSCSPSRQQSNGERDKRGMGECNTELMEATFSRHFAGIQRYGEWYLNSS